MDPGRATIVAMDAPPAPPDLRILQANERTLLAWVRTGLGIMAFGFVVARLGLWLRTLQGTETGGGSMAVGEFVVLLGTATLVTGAVRFVRAHRAIVRHEPHIPGTLPGVLLAGTLAGAGVALAAYLAWR